MKLKLQMIWFILLLVILSGCRSKLQKLTEKPILNDALRKEVVTTICENKTNNVTALKYRYNNQTYYFDSKECMVVFKKNPEKFSKKENFNNKSKQQMSHSLVGYAAVVYMLLLMVSIVFVGHLKKN